MPVLISLKFDGGEKVFLKGLDKTLDELKDMRGLFQRFIDYFEGKVKDQDSPIIEIWKSQGGVINANWSTSPDYQEWKDKNWSKMRKVEVPITGPAPQVLTGMQLAGLLDKNIENAVREVGPMAMIYGVENEYSNVQQEKRKILDIFPGMDSGMERMTARFISDNAKELEMEDVK